MLLHLLNIMSQEFFKPVKILCKCYLKWIQNTLLHECAKIHFIFSSDWQYMFHEHICTCSDTITCRLGTTLHIHLSLHFWFSWEHVLEMGLWDQCIKKIYLVLNVSSAKVEKPCSKKLGLLNNWSQIRKVNSSSSVSLNIQSTFR